MSIKQLENNGLKAVQILRKTKLSKGQPFMINSRQLPSNQCFLEFPEGSIKVVTIDKKENEFVVLKELSAEEILEVRKKYKLI
jgi:hypothetical protein